MAIVLSVYNKFREALLTGHDFDWNNDTIKAMLVANTYTPDIDAHDFLDDVRAHEIANGNGYTTNGATLASKTVTIDTANDRVAVDAADLSWASANFTAKYVVIYKDVGGADATRLLVCVFDLDDSSSSASKTVQGGTFALNFNAAGIFAI